VARTRVVEEAAMQLAPSSTPFDFVVHQLGQAADGKVALRDALGVDASDLEALAVAGATALDDGRFETAVEIFSALCALSPDDTLHTLHLAFAHQGAGRRHDAIAALSRMLDGEASTSTHDFAEGLLLRAELLAPIDSRAAMRDIAAVRRLAARSHEVNALIARRLP
jgi:tetratricopeptide (TPR) repeat protein